MTLFPVYLNYTGPCIASPLHRHRLVGVILGIDEDISRVTSSFTGHYSVTAPSLHVTVTAATQ